MKSFENADNLAANITLPEHTSQVVDIFCTTRQPILSMDDKFKIIIIIIIFRFLQFTGRESGQICDACKFQKLNDTRNK